MNQKRKYCTLIILSLKKCAQQISYIPNYAKKLELKNNIRKIFVAF